MTDTTQTTTAYGKHLKVAKALAAHFPDWTLSIEHHHPADRPQIRLTRNEDGACFDLKAYCDRGARFEVSGFYPTIPGLHVSPEERHRYGIFAPRISVSCKRAVKAIAKDIEKRFLNQGGYLKLYLYCLSQQQEHERLHRYRQEKFTALRSHLAEHWRVREEEHQATVSFVSNIDGFYGHLYYAFACDSISLNLRRLDWETARRILNVLAQ
ncbi:MAG: hypothetical protein SWY16_04540 [Cyanobacteriota bacterium]|nr:hypothetical protein [Cyanobacteriota bacterium]